MPYIVPSSAASTSSVTPPHSPSRPPLALSVALASPAPVPPHTPFTLPELPTSPRLAASEHTTQSLLSAAKEVAGHRPSPLHPLSLVKAMSNPTTVTPRGPLSSTETPPSSSIRRVVSTSDASPIANVYQYANTTGSSLPHVPRRRTGSTSSLPEKQEEETAVRSPNTAPRGRGRSRFVLGNEEENGSGNGQECRGRNRNMTNGKAVEMRQHGEERLTRKRPVSIERSLPKAGAPNPSPVVLKGASDSSSSDTEGSDCPTPTPSRIAKSHRPHEPRPNQNGLASVSASITSVASLTQRRDGAQRFMFASDSEDEADRSRNGTSTIEFPSMPPSPPPAIAVDNPTPEIAPFASPPQCASPKSFAGKRANAGSLRLDFSFGSLPGESNGSTNERSRPGEHGRSLSESASLNSMPLIRKKSGEVVRSALRSRSSSASSARQRPSVSLGDISSFAMGSPSVSAPTTPSATTKMVHFDAQLEHVKIFKSTSRPVAVSRDGSPTYDDTTSGGEGDSASEGASLSELIPHPRPRRLVPGGTPSEEEEALRRVLMMRVLNMPHREMEIDDADVRLEALHLADDAASVQGIVCVRNIAFEKSVAVRFTFDGWQTTSEVLGHWIESCIPRKTTSLAMPKSRTAATNSTGEKVDESPVPTFDRFTFSIRLADMLLRINEKTLVLAIRYCTAGREMWDNNDGQNYRAVFERRPRHSLTLSGSAVVPPNPDSANDNSYCDETGRKPGSAGGTSSSIATPDSDRTNLSGMSMLMLDKALAGTKEGQPLSPSKRPCDLASRYDLDSSLRNRSTWRPSFEQLRTWAGRDRDNALIRAAMPWSRERHGGREGTDKPIGAHLFKTHDLSFNNRAVAHGSPRDLDIDTLDDSEVEHFSRVRFAAAEEIGTPDGTPLHRLNGGINRFISPPMSFAFSGLGSEPHARNHHRSYFDSWAANGYSTSTFGTGKARLTPPGTPRPLDPRSVSDFNAAASPTAHNTLPMTTSGEEPQASLPGRTYSFPPTMLAGNGSAAAGLGLMTGRPRSGKGLETRHNASDSEASTPSITSVSSPSTTASPSSPPDFPTLTSAVRVNPKTPCSTAMDATSYNAFLSSFCFYGDTHERLEIPSSEIRRTHSASEMQELLSTSPLSSSEVFPLIKDYTSLSSEVDSRATTPTPNANTGLLSPGVVEPPPTSAAFLETESGVSPRVRC